MNFTPEFIVSILLKKNVEFKINTSYNELFLLDFDKHYSITDNKKFVRIYQNIQFDFGKIYTKEEILNGKGSWDRFMG